VSSVLKTNDILYTHASSCEDRRREIADEGDQPQRHSRLLDIQW